jgi:ATP-binding cassette, subfamily B, bacterial MsbA
MSRIDLDTILREMRLPPERQARLRRRLRLIAPLLGLFLRIFFRQPKHATLYLRLVSYIYPYRRQFLLAFFCMILTGILDASPIALLKPILDDVFTQHDRGMLLLLPLGLVFLFTAKGVTHFIQKFIMRTIGQRAMRDLRKALFQKILRLPHSFFQHSKSGDLIARITNDIQIIDQGVSTVVSNLVKDVFSILATVAIIFYFDWRFGVVAMVSIPILVAPIGYLAQIMRRAGRITQEMIAELTVVAQEAFQGISIVKAFRGEHHEEKRFHKANEEYFGQAKRAIKASAISTPLTEFIGAVIAAGVLYAGGRFVMDGMLSAGTFITCLVALFKMYMPFKELGNVNHAVQQTAVVARRLFEILDTPLDVRDTPEARPLPPFSREVEFRSVSFSYDEGEEVLHKVSFRVKKGEMVAFVGPSGAGKTTLAHLIPRFFDVTGGALLIDGHDVREVTIESLRRQIGMVTQDVILFHDTVLGNITYGSDEHDPERAIEAARAAYAHEFIKDFPEGYQTVIGERGLRLSGGQRQRLSIARALYHDPAILLLDEATSALDTESEMVVQKAIQNLVANRTTLVIAHRLSTIRHVDRIVVLHEGHIVEEGTHDQLMANASHYKRLHDLQFNS